MKHMTIGNKENMVQKEKVIAMVVLLVLFGIAMYFLNSAHNADEENVIVQAVQQSYTPPETQPIIDEDYKAQAWQAAGEARRYCQTNPFGIYRTILYLRGQPIPLTVQC